VIITARKDEYDETVKVDAAALDDWHTERVAGFDVAFRSYGEGGKTVRVGMTWATKMRAPATADAAGSLVDKLGARLVAMSGVCGGRRGRVVPGDVVVGTLLYTYDTGGIEVELDATGQRVERFKAEPDPYPLAEPLHRAADAYRTEAPIIFKDAPWLVARPPNLEEQGDWVLFQLRQGEDPAVHADSQARCPSWQPSLERLKKLNYVVVRPGLKLTESGTAYIDHKLVLNRNKLPPPPKWGVHPAPMATGNNVMRDPTLFDRLSNTMRDVLGVDMEASAIGRIAHARGLPWVVMKGVMDHADHDKDDELKPFAARAAAECLFRFLRTKAF
jgi:nucleoside phosphorylase